MKNVSIRKIAFLVFGIMFGASLGYCQDNLQLLGEVAKVYTGSEGSAENLIAGFSIWGLVGGVVFGSIGFIAFMYGKKNSEFRPMVTGLVLMVYPYLFKETLWLYVIGIVLTAVLFFWRE